MTNEPPDPAILPTGQYDEAAINRARNLLDAMPENVGPYRILERLGGGGMGDVYRAEQRSPMRRDVALKFIKLGMDTKLVIARFEAERQALALMDHPHIAKVFDAGTDDTGRPFFVMEYVKGKPITEYADQNHLSISERLELFEQVCQAVQHAHHKGVIHRDLKPGNVLVSTQDGKPFSKVIDFGIAKAIAQRLTDHTLFTEHAQFIGTPQYMSPEQAEGSVDIDTRTDVYSLGVMLYELLTGSTPFSSQELKAAAFDQIKKMIIEVDPPKPSTRLSLNQPTLPTLAASRRIEPKRLGTIVQGELDWIVMKALEKDRKRRYETPTSLANDVQAHLKGEPVQAAPPSTAYRVQKFVRKHRGPVMATGAVILVLLLGIVGTTTQMLRAQTAEYKSSQLNSSLDEHATALEQTLVEWYSEMNAAQTPNVETSLRLASGMVGVEAEIKGGKVVRSSIWKSPKADPEIARKDVREFLHHELMSGLKYQREEELKLENALARGFVRPLIGDDVLTPPEIEDLWELATLDRDRVGLRMFDIATQTPQTTEQLLKCAEPAIVAAIFQGHGEDMSSRRDWILDTMRPRLNDGTLRLDHRAGIAWITLMLLDKPGPDSSICVKLIKEAIAVKTPSPTVAQSYAVDYPDRVAALLMPEIAAEFLLAILLDPEQRSERIEDLAMQLSRLSARLDPTDAARVRMAADKLAERLVDRLIALLNDRNHGAYARFRLPEAFVAFPSHFEPSTAARIEESLLAALADPKQTSQHLDDLVKAFLALSARLGSGAAARISAMAADRLLTLVVDPKVPDRRAPCETLVSLSSLLEPPVAMRITERLLTALADSKQPLGELHNLTDPLLSLTVRLDQATAARVVVSVADRLVAVLADPKLPAHGRLMYPIILSRLGGHLEPTDAARITDALLVNLADPNWNYTDRNQLPQALASLSAGLDPAAAARVADAMVKILKDPKKNSQEYLTNMWAFPYLLKNLAPAAAARVSATVLDSELASLVDPKRHTGFIAPDSGIGLDESGLSIDESSLAVFIAYLEPTAIDRFSNLLLTSLADPEITDGKLASIAMVLSALSARLESSMAERVRETVCDRLIAALADPKRTTGDLSRLIGIIAPLSAHIKPDTAERISGALLATFAGRECSVDEIHNYSLVLQALSARLDSVRANRIALQATRNFSDKRFDQPLLADPTMDTALAESTRYLNPPIRQKILRELFSLQMELRYYVVGEGPTFPNPLVLEILSIMQSQEPHHATMTRPSKDEEEVTESPAHAFSKLKLTTPEIVEFLKSPLVHGDHRRAFLDLLECRYGQRFGNQWAFVEYAEAEKLGLDFTSRVKRPDPKAILQNIRKLLDEEAAKP